MTLLGSKAKQLNGSPFAIADSWDLEQATADLLTLAAIPVASYNDGVSVFVQSLGVSFTYSYSNADTADGITIVDSDVQGQWVRNLLPVCNLDASDVYVDATTVSPEGDGTAPLPFASLKEVIRRWRGRPLTGSRTVYVVGDHTETVSFSGAFEISGDLSSSITIVGTKTTLATGTITTYVDMSGTTSNALSATLSTGTLAGFAGKRLRLTSGAHVGAVCWIGASAESGNQCTSQWTEFSAFSIYTFATAITPLVGDTFVVESLSEVNLSHLDIGIGLFPAITIQDCKISGPLSTVTLKRNATSVLFRGCTFTAGVYDFGAAFYLGCSFGATITYYGTGSEFYQCHWGGSSSLAPQSGAFAYLNRCTFDASRGVEIASLARVKFDGGRHINTQTVSYSNGGSHIKVRAGGLLEYNTGKPLSGSGAANYGVSLDPGGARMISSGFGSSAITIAGTAGDYEIANTNSVYAFDPATLAPTTRRTASWSNMNTTIAGGGFGGRSEAGGSSVTLTTYTG